MVDAVGTSRYSYTAWGALLSEDGPWDNDTVTYAYTTNRLRSQLTLAQPNASAWVHIGAYDNIGQLATALGKESGGSTTRWNEQFRYGYDAAGNLSNRVANVLTNVFHVDSLNQLTSMVRTNSSLTVAGHVLGTATSVTVADNGSAAVAASLYADGTFARTNVSALNGANTFVAVAQDAAGRADTNTVTAQLPIATTFLYDLNGNMRTNGSVVYAYDDENQLVAITNAGAWASVFQYDGKLRRRVRKEFSWSGGAWVQTNEVRYVYDGNLPIQERDSFNVPKLTLTRGPDLSGGFQGAGGIGGLLARTDNATLTVGGSGAYAYLHADGNGNVTALIDANAAVVAQYLYDPYGNTLRASGPAAEANLYRFSSKELHQTSGLIYYLYRYYAPDLQRWVNRDPIWERGGINLCSFVANSPVNWIDTDGRAILPPLPPKMPSPDTVIEKCNRKIENDGNDWIVGIANVRGHDYFGWPAPDGGPDGVGFRNENGKDGDLPQSEKGSKSRTCRPCWKSNSPLKYGKGAGKPGTSASDDDIKDCLKRRPIKGNYHGTKNNCNDWARGAEKDCGLFCP